MDINDQESAPKKRKLLNESDVVLEQTSSADTGLAEIERGDIWMDDGNLIIQAGQKQFRVHKSILSRCSSVFKDMFSLPQPSETSMEGCPVVHLHDSPEDVTHLLTAIYDYRYSADPTSNDIVQFRVLSALLRLGNKYDIPHLRKNMLLRIHAEYPTSLEKVDFQKFHYIEGTKTITIDMVNLLYQEGIFSALPVALYIAMEVHEMEQLLGGIENEDGTKSSLLPCLILPVVLGKERLVKFMSETSYKWLREGNMGSAHKSASCGKFFSALEKIILHPMTNLAYALDYSWTDTMSTIPYKDTDLCGTCIKTAKTCYEEGRRATFEALPSMFGYLSWDDVKKMDVTSCNP